MRRRECHADYSQRFSKLSRPSTASYNYNEIAGRVTIEAPKEMAFVAMQLGGLNSVSEVAETIALHAAGNGRSQYVGGDYGETQERIGPDWRAYDLVPREGLGTPG